MIIPFTFSFALTFFRLWWNWMILKLVGTMDKSDFLEKSSNWKSDFCNFEYAISKVLPVVHSTTS
jgi:hypothetical protein